MLPCSKLLLVIQSGNREETSLELISLTGFFNFVSIYLLGKNKLFNLSTFCA